MKRHTMFAGAFALTIAFGPAFLGPVVLASDALTPRLSSPVVGYVFEASSQTLRTVSGVPGAAHLAAAVAVPETLHDVTVSSAGRVAVGVTKDKRLVVVAWGDDAVGVTALDSSLGPLEQVAFSRSGARLALRDAAGVEVWSNLREQPTLVRSFAAVGAIAINDAGEVAVASVDSISLHGEGDPRILAASSAWTAVAFAANGTDLLAADAGRLEVVRITQGGALTTLAALPTAASSVLEALEGGTIAALAGTQVLVIPQTGEVSVLDCACDSKSLDALTGNLVAALRGTTLVLDADSAPPRLTTLFHVPNAGVSQ